MLLLDDCQQDAKSLHNVAEYDYYHDRQAELQFAVLGHNFTEAVGNRIGVNIPAVRISQGAPQRGLVTPDPVSVSGGRLIIKPEYRAVSVRRTINH